MLLQKITSFIFQGMFRKIADLKVSEKFQKTSLVGFLLGNLNFPLYSPQLYCSLHRKCSCEFYKNFQNCWERVFFGISFVKCLWWNQFSNRINFCVLHLCQKPYNLRWYVTRSRSRTLELWKKFHLTRVEDLQSSLQVVVLLNLNVKLYFWKVV